MERAAIRDQSLRTRRQSGLEIVLPALLSAGGDRGNPVSAAAALAVLETIERDRLIDKAAEVGRHLMGLLERLKHKHRLIGDVRGRGLAIGIELVTDRAGKASARTETALVVYRCFELGLVLYYVGVNANVLEFTPPLTLTKPQPGSSFLTRLSRMRLRAGSTGMRSRPSRVGKVSNHRAISRSPSQPHDWDLLRGAMLR